MTAFRNKLGGPMSAIILVALVLLLALDIGFWLYHRSNSTEAVNGGELIVKVGSPATGVLVDPSGSRRVAERSAPGQNTVSANSSTEPSTITIPKLEPGDYSLVLRGLSNGESRFVIQALYEGQPAFRYVGTANVSPESEWLVRLHVEVLNGLVQDVRVISYAPGASGASGTGSGEPGGNATTSAMDAVRSAIVHGLSRASGYVQDQWVTFGSMLFLALVLAAIWKKR